MANEEQLSILRQGVDVWNEWRRNNSAADVDLIGADLHGLNLSSINLSLANLSGADLHAATLYEANFYGSDLSEAKLSNATLDNANLSKAILHKANLEEARLWGARFLDSNLSGANLQNATLIFANFVRANLTGANLIGANLKGAILVETNIDNAKLSRSLVYGISAWDLIGEFDEQTDLIISRNEEAVITVDTVEVAQFIYLLVDNKKIRDAINTLTSKTVLILGRFTIPERKAILDALRNKLREYDLLPIVFDFDRPTDKDFTETIKTLAGISYFVIADVTNPKSSPLELQATVPDYQIPFVPIIQEGESPFAMMVDLQKKYPWVLPTRSYDSIETLMNALKPGIIDPAVEMRNKLRLVKAQEQVTESLRDYVDKSL